jgi:inner membrane transporter RhtA
LLSPRSPLVQLGQQCDLLALRRVPARFFGVFMSLNPVLAAAGGLVILNQSLGLPDWLSITVIVAANAVSIGSGYRRGAEPSTGGTRPSAAAPAAPAAPAAESTVRRASSSSASATIFSRSSGGGSSPTASSAA